MAVLQWSTTNLTDLEEFWKVKWLNVAQSRCGKLWDLPRKTHSCCRCQRCFNKVLTRVYRIFMHPTEVPGEKWVAPTVSLISPSSFLPGGLLSLCPRAESGDCETREACRGRGWLWHRRHLKTKLNNPPPTCFASTLAIYDENNNSMPLVLVDPHPACCFGYHPALRDESIYFALDEVMRCCVCIWMKSCYFLVDTRD